ncbi:MAG: Protein involved in biosynthesis of mitomycin antibiotics/polyketide fumonisin [Verrucomicrobia bacterium]|nr:Protein involved in biosynthesis of mitomycin antibiotics/polyketide fumonisin [Verrucomicrobiota bacterium]
MKTENLPALPAEQKRTAAADFARDGFFIAPPLIPAELLARVRPRIDAVYAGEYETGIPPCGSPKGSSVPPTSLVKIDNTHRSDRTIHELVSHPAIGRWAAALTGAKTVQVFATQLLIKPPGSTGAGNVGWHQDYEYWDYALEGDVFTAWVAVSDVTAESGPMRFVRGSHRWGLLKAGDFFGGDLGAIQQRILAKTGGAKWEERAAVLAPGAVSFHHKLTVHGSGPNLSTGPRVSFAIHLRTDQSRFPDGLKWETVPYLNDPDDMQGSPITYRETA